MPNFFVIGAARSGTTALMDALRRHPDVFVTEPKEPHYPALAGREASFQGPGDDATVNRVAVTDHERYLDLYEGAAGFAARGEGSVSTMYYAAASIDTIARRFPDARFVAILRDPVERAFSSFQYQRARGYEPCEDFEAALDLEDERVERDWQHLWHYRRMGYYDRQLQPFRERFGPDRLQVVFHDDLAARPDHVLSSVLGFLGVPVAAVAVPRLNASGEPRSRRLTAVVERVRQQPRLTATMRRLIPPVARERMRAANLRPASLPPAAATRLASDYVDDLAALRSWLGGELPAWLHR